MTLRHAVRVTALSVSISVAALATAAAEPPVPPVPGVSEDVGSAILQMGSTLSARELSFTARTMRVYLDEAGQPLHIFHNVRAVVRRPNRLALEVVGDDGAHDLFYDGKSVSVFSPDINGYSIIPASGDIPSALNEVVDKLHVDFPLGEFLTNAPDKSFLNGVVAGWQVGTAIVDGVECRHLFFVKKGGVELELWVENNSASLPHRLVVTYRMLPSQPNFIAEFTSWDMRDHPSDSDFIFQPPPGARKIELGANAAPATRGEGR